MRNIAERSIVGQAWPDIHPLDRVDEEKSNWTWGFGFLTGEDRFWQFGWEVGDEGCEESENCLKQRSFSRIWLLERIKVEWKRVGSSLREERWGYGVSAWRLLARAATGLGVRFL